MVEEQIKTDLQAYLIEQAPKDICNEGKKALGQKLSPAELSQLYKTHIDFCFDNNFPDQETLLKYGKEELKEEGFYINEKATINNAPFVVALGNSELNISVNEYNIAQIFAKGSTQLNISVEHHGYVMVDAFDDCKIKVTAKNTPGDASDDKAKAVINVYGNAHVEYEGNVTIINKLKNSYE